MNEWPKPAPVQGQEGIQGEISYTPIQKLLPDIKMENLKEGNFDDLLEPEKENIARADEAGTLKEATMLDTGYAAHLGHDLKRLALENPEVYEAIRNLFERKLLVDLAAGSREYGYGIARTLGSSAYVGVEPYNGARLSDMISFSEEGNKNREPDSQETIPYTVVAEDILTFLKRLPDQMPEVSFLSSGSDRNIFPNQYYNDAVIKELQRVLAPDSGIIFYDSVFDNDRDSQGMRITTVTKQSHPLRYARKR